MTKRVNFKRCKAGFNLEVFFSYTGCFTKVIELNVVYYLSIAGRRDRWFHAFLKDISAK